MTQTDLPFGEALGALHGVTAYSNLDDSFFSGEKHFLHGIYTGYKYQCVEFARRYLLATTACQFEQCFRAAEIFSMKKLVNVETGEDLELVACPNGKTSQKPQPGNILVYPWDEEKMPVGHVAIVAEVGDDWVGIAEQNEESYSWHGKCYGRKVNLRQEAETGFWIMEETDPEFNQCSGWMYAPAAARRPDSKVPLKPLAQFLPNESDELAVNRRRVVVLNDEEKAARVSWQHKHIPPPKSDAESALTAYLTEKKPQWLPGMKSIIYPNETSGVGCIGGFNGSFRCIAHGLQQIFRENLFQLDNVAAWASERYGIPLPLATLIADQVDPMHVHDCFAVTMNLSFVDQRPVMISTDLDNLSELFESAVLQGQVASVNGHEEGWTPSITKDVKRFVETYLKPSKHHPELVQTLHFVDLGPSSQWASHGVFTSVEEEQAYDLYRLNALVLLDFVNAARPDAGCVTPYSEITTRVDGILESKSSGVVIRKVQKMCQWEFVLRIAAVDAAVKELFVDAYSKGVVSIFPPIYTKITSSSNFLSDLEKVFQLRDESVLTEGQVELKEFLPKAHVVAQCRSGDFSSLTSMNATFEKVDGGPKVQIRIRAISISGYWSTGSFLEHLVGSREDNWNCGCYRFIMHHKEFNREEEVE